jgi:hypothetical protein
MAEMEYGGSHPGGLHWFLASNLLFEDGWRDASPSNVRQFFGKVGRQRERTSLEMTVAFANNALILKMIIHRRGPFLTGVNWVSITSGMRGTQSACPEIISIEHLTASVLLQES